MKQKSTDALRGMKTLKHKITNENAISSYCHCSLCLNEIPEGESPQSYTRYEIGFTQHGIQVWCKRHDCNIMHIDFEGTKHPANTSRARTQDEKNKLN